jgi:hypothetical protein
VLLQLDENSGDKFGWGRTRISEDQFARIETPDIKKVEVSPGIHKFLRNIADHAPLGLELEMACSSI